MAVETNHKMKIKAKDRQTLIDVALSECGSVMAAFAMSELNDVSLTATPGELEIYGIEIDNETLAFFKNKKLSPATDFDSDESDGNNSESEDDVKKKE